MYGLLLTAGTGYGGGHLILYYGNRYLPYHQDLCSMFTNNNK